MLPFDSKINVTNIGLELAEDNKSIQVQLEVSQVLPAGDQLVVAPLARYRFNLDRDSAIAIGKSLQEEGGKLIAPSKLEIASDLSQAEMAAGLLGNIKNG